MTSATSNAAQPPRADPSEVGWMFVQEYYTFMNREPERLHCFYNKKSYFVHGSESEQSKLCHGQQVRDTFDLAHSLYSIKGI